MNFFKHLSKLKIGKATIKTPFFEIDFAIGDKDKDAAWILYIEIVTRIASQQMADDEGDDKTALDSLFNIFKLTRELIKTSGRDCKEFSKIAIVILNLVLRPFLTKWHKGDDTKAHIENHHAEFRNDLHEVQDNMRIYTSILAEMLELEDVTSFVMQTK
ncbi:MAG: hypothetical protein RIS47_1254 [Bacteroidota bacterium]|jgi:hypothetical protein